MKVPFIMKGLSVLAEHQTPKPEYLEDTVSFRSCKAEKQYLSKAKSPTVSLNVTVSGYGLEKESLVQ